MQSGVVWLGALIVVNLVYIGWGWSPGGSDAAVARPQLSSIGPSLRLLAEIPPAEIVPVTESAPVDLPESEAQPQTHASAILVPAAAAPPERAPAAVVCHYWGPFDNRAELEKVEADLAAAGGETRVTQSTIPGRSDYLVYIGTLGKAENARRVLEELKSQSIDSALIARGRFNNTLSVGVFSRNDRAERQRRKVARLGYNAGIEEIDRSYAIFHLEARVGADFEPSVAPNGPCSEIAQAN